MLKKLFNYYLICKQRKLTMDYQKKYLLNIIHFYYE